MKFCVAAFLLASVLLAPATGIAVTPESGAAKWYVVRIAGSPVGFASEGKRSDGDRVVFLSTTDLSMARMGTPLSMFLLVEEVSDEKGRYISSRMEMKTSITGSAASAEAFGDSVRHTFEAGGATRTQTLAWDPGAVTQVEAETLTRRWIATGTPEMFYTIFHVADGTFKQMRMVRDESLNTEDGLVAVRQYEGDGDTPTSTIWFDADGESIRTVVAQMGLEIEIERIREEDMATIDLEPNFDIIRESMIPVDGYPDPLDDVESVTLRLEFPHPLPGTRSFDGPNQKEVGRGDNWVDVSISRDTATKLTMREEERAPFLASGQYIQADDKGIKAVADSIRAASGLEGWALAREISLWVGAHITEKNFAQGFASALEVFKTCTGDCTEHSVLLTAMLRAAGIPARPAVGLAYSRGQFVGHMWTEVYVDHWRTLDALDPAADPIRLRVSAATTNRAVDERALVEAYAVVGGMKATVIAHTSR